MRQRPPVLAHLRFIERQAELKELGFEALFTEIYRSNLWGAEESRSGLGSATASTAVLRSALPALFDRRGVRCILDIPCGDFGWLSQVALGERTYLGADIVAELVERNRALFARDDGRLAFAKLDLVSDELPASDLVLCRDCLVHLSFANVFAALANVRRSGARWLLTTTFLDDEENADAADGDWRMLNLTRPPFDLPAPVEIIVEGCTDAEGAYADKALGLWPVAALPVPAGDAG